MASLMPSTKYTGCETLAAALGYCGCRGLPAPGIPPWSPFSPGPRNGGACCGGEALRIPGGMKPAQELECNAF